jgi:hypothetical protein
VFVLVSAGSVMMCRAIDNPASCKIRAVICFLHTKNMNAVKIYRELCTIYGQNVMSEGTVRQWCRMFKLLTKKFVKYGTAQFQNFHVNFHKFHALFPMRLS